MNAAKLATSLASYRSPAFPSPPGGGAGASSGASAASGSSALAASSVEPSTPEGRLAKFIADKRDDLVRRRAALDLQAKIKPRTITPEEAGTELRIINALAATLSQIEKHAARISSEWQSYRRCGGLSSCMYKKPTITIEHILIDAKEKVGDIGKIGTIERDVRAANASISAMHSEFASSFPPAPPVPTHKVRSGGKRRHRTSKKTKRSKKLRTRRLKSKRNKRTRRHVR